MHYTCKKNGFVKDVTCLWLVKLITDTFPHFICGASFVQRHRRLASRVPLQQANCLRVMNLRHRSCPFFA